jgi:serine phosphatase RsbU (regulator of sigma subunit)
MTIRRSRVTRSMPDDATATPEACARVTERHARSPAKDDREHRSLRLELAAQRPDVSELRDPDNDQQALIASLRREAAIRDEQLAGLRERLGVAEHELEDLRAIRDALTPPELPHRPGLDLATAFLPASAEQVSGDFYLVVEGPQDLTVLARVAAFAYGA